MARSYIVESEQFLVGDVWQGHRYSSPLTLVVGESGAGKSAGLEVLWYAVGLTSVKVMPAVRSCACVRVVFRIDDVRWQVTRSTQSTGGEVEFVNLSDAGRPAVPVPVTGKNGQQSAAEFFQELLGIPLLGHAAGRLGMTQLLPWMYLRQATLTTQYLGGLSSAQRRLAGRTLLGAHDAAVERLREIHAAKKQAWQTSKGLLDKLNAARAERDLPDHTDLDTTHAQWTAQHTERTQQTREAGALLRRLAAQHQALVDKAKQCGPAQDAARRAADESEKTLRAMVGAEREAAGRLSALREVAGEPTGCPQCGKALVLEGLAPDQCPVCKEPDADRTQRARAAAARITSASRTLDQAVAASRRATETAAGARARAAEADLAVRSAYAAAEEFENSTVAPQRARVLELEAQSRELAARLEQLVEHLKELAVIKELTRDLPALDEARKAAKQEWEVAEKDVDVHVKLLTERWSSFFLARMQSCDPRVRSAFIDPEDFSSNVDGHDFDSQVVAGARLGIINMNAALSLRDVGREVPSMLVPQFLAIDSPLSGLGSHGEDARIAANVMRMLSEAAITCDRQGRPPQLIIAVNDPQAQPATGVREIHISKASGFIPGLPSQDPHE
ncbi:hypothetical protein [Streptacidiphilus cavernicola]|uniref:Rad50/SbcC-type AAA domain-containing protein n=1 Tax=Streptacidiphilus cavernicola TaxID=3342716 RepID=A0ABV6W5M0_9ACTN